MKPDRVIKEKKTDPRWSEWGRLGRWSVVGHKIIEGNKGHRPDKLERARYMLVNRPWDVMYEHSYGLVSRFFEELTNKRLFGKKCPKCGDIFCPPRAHCWRNSCRLCETEWVEMPLHGTLHCFTILGFAGEAFLSDLPFVLCYVRVDGANTMIAGRLVGMNPEDVECDMTVRVNFIENPTGTPMDIYFTPDGPPLDRRPSRDKERIRKQLEPIREYVKARFGK
jgi:uncharacterized OB-fold protein